ncbi:MAG: hypothetical protein GY953_19220, partial [bacterium]|nr:hypothetical protein [bacterium]
NLQERLRDEGIEVEVTEVRVGDSAEETLAALPADADAVYVTPLLELGEGEFNRLIEGLIERKLPSFSLWGREEVEMGIMAGLGLNLDMARIARRTALNLQRILLGERAADMPALFERRQRLTINMRTARAIQVFPSWALMTEAELVSEQRPTVERMVSLASAVREAAQGNLDLLS